MGRNMKLISILVLSYSVATANLLSQKVSENLVVRATRTIDVTSQVVKTNIFYEVTNSGQSTVDSFLHGMTDNERLQLAWWSANWEKKEGKKLKTIKVNVDEASKELVYYKIDFPSPLGAGETAKIVIRAEFTQLLKPLPVEITQMDTQFMVYTCNVYMDSPYKVEKQSTSFKIGNTQLVDFTPVEPSKHQSDTVRYGPYNNIAAGSNQPVTIHFENNSPFLVVTSLSRWIEVSHWGNLAIEDTVHVTHRGARLKGSFSRLDFQMDRRSNNHPAVKQFKTQLPLSARDIYYRDRIGNISTSTVIKRANRIEVDIKPRFPLFGGWKTDYILGYNMPTVGFLYSSGSKYALKVPFIDRVYDNAVIEEVTVRIVLPEASKNVKVVNPFLIKQLPDQVHKTYLDSVGRTVVVLKKENVVNSHASPITIYYEFDHIMMLREPLLVVTAFFIIFLAVIIFVRLDFSITEKPEQHVKKE